MENKGTIEEIALKAGKKGDFYSVKIGSRTYNIFKDAGPAFEQLQKKEFVRDEFVGFDYTEHTGDIKGEPVVFKNLIEFHKITGQSNPIDKISTTGWTPPTTTPDMRETRICRMNSLTNAIGFFDLNKEALAEQAQASGGFSEITVLKLAEKFEEWINRKKAEQ
jgi:hypothetical protein